MSKTGSLPLSKSASFQGLKLFQSRTDLACALNIFCWGEVELWAVTRSSTGRIRLKEEDLGYFGYFFWVRVSRKAPAQPQLGSWELCQARMNLGCCLARGSFPGSPIPAVAA